MNEPDLHMDHLADIWQKLSEIGSTKEFQGKVLAGLVVGLVLMILGFIFRIPQRIWRRINAQSIRVREIRRRRDPDLHSFLQVYESRIDAEYRVSSDDIIAWADHPQVGRIAGRKDFSLIAKKNGVCLAILKAMCIRKERLAFVAYLATRGRPSESSDGTDEAEGRKAIDALIGWLDRRLHRRGCKALVFEVSADDDGARVRLFRQYATLHNRKCLRIEMDYRQPKMDTGGGLGGEKKCPWYTWPSASEAPTPA